MVAALFFNREIRTTMQRVDEFSPYIHPFKVHVPNLLNETFENAIPPKVMAALRIPMNEFQRYLRSLVARCAELNDPVLNKIMCDMTLYEQSNIESEEYSQEMVEQVNANYNQYLRDNGLFQPAQGECQSQT